jgi:excisionase family DNA binding protein
MQQIKPGLLSVNDAAAKVRIGRTLLYKLMDQGDLAYVKLGRARRIDPADLDDLVRRSHIGGQDVT